MTEKEFRWLRRGDLIEIIYELQKSESQLLKENEELKEQLAKSRQVIDKSQTLNEAADKLNQVFAAAQRAAAEYLDFVNESSQAETESSARMDLQREEDQE